FGLRLLLLTDALRHGEVGHEVVGCGAVPVPLVSGCVDHVAGTDVDDVAAPGLHTAYALGDVERLAEGVGVPRGACTRGEADGIDADARGLLTSGDGVDPDVPGEPIGRTLGRRRLGRDF